MNFNDFPLDHNILDGLEAMGFRNGTPIQAQAIPIILEGHDMIACAQTGTGKTAAYLLPIMHNILEREEIVEGINTLIIAPTRELARQIDQQLEGFAYFTDVTSIPIYGGGDGVDFVKQKKALVKGTDVIIATPGKLIAHLNMGYVNVDNLQHLILDEADKMLDMGFYDDIMRIVSYLPKERQTLLFSATMPDKMRKLAKGILNNPEQINIAVSKPAEGVTQAAYMVHEDQKIALVKHLLADKEALSSVIIFCSTKRATKEAAQQLKKEGFKAGAIHSDLEQDVREEILRQFKAKNLQILIGTDVLSRGIDVKGINLVINYDIPPDAEVYVHRIGRTARADAEGMAFTFISDRDQYKFKRIEDFLETEVEKRNVPESIGKSPKWRPKMRSANSYKRNYGGKKGSGKKSYKGKGKYSKSSSNSKKK